jgi:hypothetical protein
VQLLDLRSLDDPSNWKSQLGTAYGAPIQYGDIALERYLIGDYRERIRQSPTDIDVYGLTSNFTYEANAVRETIRALRAHNPKALIAIGGRDAAQPERHKFYFDAGVDFIGEGDADESFARFLQGLTTERAVATERARLGGSRRFLPMFSQQNDKLIAAIPVAEMPFIDLDAVFPNWDYVRPRLRESGGGSILDSVAAKGFATYVETSRGCPRECNFCTEARTKTIRLDIPALKKQIDHFLDHGAGLLMFSDDNLLTRKEADLIEIFQYLRDRGTSWEFPVGLEVGLMTDSKKQPKKELIQSLFWNNGKRDDWAGVHRMLFPVEDSLLRSTNLSKLKKNVQTQILEAILDTGIPFLNMAIMIGGVQETPDERKILEEKLFEFRRMAEKSQTRINFSVFCTMPLPGTEFSGMMQRDNRVAYDINEHPELWSVFCSVLRGNQYMPEEITSYRRSLLAQHNMQHDLGKVQVTGDR